jgi:hypothetical protein
MSGFDAAEIVPEDDLAFDFTKYDGPEGTIPEPTRELLDAYWERMRDDAETAGLDRDKILEAERLGGVQTPEGRVAIVEAYASADPEKLKEMPHHRIAAVAELCQGAPSKDQIEALPYRVQEAFVAWLMEKFSRPPTTNGSTG